MNSLWLYHCIQADDVSGGEKIWTKYLANAPSDQRVFMPDFAIKCLEVNKNEKLKKQVEELAGKQAE